MKNLVSIDVDYYSFVNNNFILFEKKKNKKLLITSIFNYKLWYKYKL